MSSKAHTGAVADSSHTSDAPTFADMMPTSDQEMAASDAQTAGVVGSDAQLLLGPSHQNLSSSPTAGGGNASEDESPHPDATVVQVHQFPPMPPVHHLSMQSQRNKHNLPPVAIHSIGHHVSASTGQVPPLHNHGDHHSPAPGPGHSQTHSMPFPLGHDHGAPAPGHHPTISSLSRPGSAHKNADGSLRLGAGPGPKEEFGEALHSYRAKMIPLTGGTVPGRTGVGAVELAAGLFHHLGREGTEAASRRGSLNPANKPEQRGDQISPNPPTMPGATGAQPLSSRRPGSSGAENGGGAGMMVRRTNSIGPDGERRRSFNKPGQGGGHFGMAQRMIPLGRVHTMKSLDKRHDGDSSDKHDSSGHASGLLKSKHGSRAGMSRPDSKVGSGKGDSTAASSRLGDEHLKEQEIEGLDEFDAKHREEMTDQLRKRRQAVLASPGGKNGALFLDQEENEDEAAVREAIEAKRLQRKQISAFGTATLEWIDGGVGTLVMTLATIFCLFGDDIRLAACPKSSDIVFVVLSTIALVMFALEFAAFCRWREDYLWTFFFVLDLIAVFSLIPDLPFIWTPFMTAIGQSDQQNQNLAVARAGRASRAGTRAGRLVRFIRLVRFLRVVKLYKYCIAEGTLIVDAALGLSVPIESLASGQEVLGLGVDRADESGRLGVTARTITAATHTGKKRCIELLFADGRTLECTPDHSVLAGDGVWTAADDLIVGRSTVSATIEQPVFTDDTGAWAIKVGRSTFGSQHALRFARLVGRLLADGADQNDGPEAVLFLAQALDRDHALADIRLITGQHGHCSALDGATWRVAFPRALTDGLADVGIAIGARADVLSTIPDFITAPDCPLAVVREYLGGWFGGEGATLTYEHDQGQFAGLAYVASKQGVVLSVEQLAACGLVSTVPLPLPVAQIRYWEQHLLPLLTRLGVGGAKLLAPRWIHSSDRFLSSKSYPCKLVLGGADLLPFLRHIGFRYSCQKSMQSTAAACYLRGLEYVAKQRAFLVAYRDAHVGLSIPAALSAGKVELAKTQVVHPDIVNWTPTNQSTFVRDQTASSSALVTPQEAMKKWHAAKFFSAPPVDISSKQVSDANILSGGVWPLFRVGLIGKRDAGMRNVYDLTVPCPADRRAKGRAATYMDSFVAGGLVVHNCGETEEERSKREAEERLEEIERLKQEAEERLIAEMDSEIGKGFSDYITKCVIVMVLFMMFILPLLEVTETDTTARFFIQQLDVVLDPANPKIELPTPALLDSMLDQFDDSLDGRVVKLQFDAGVFAGKGFSNATVDPTTGLFVWRDDVDRYDRLRTAEMTNVVGQHAFTYVDIKYQKVDDALFSIGTTLFVTILLAGGAAIFSRNASEMVIRPIERMFLFVTKLAANPLGKIQPTGDVNQPFETQLLETTFLKLAGLLQIGFGAAGAEVISHNMVSSVSSNGQRSDFLDPMVPGRKIFAIFGFCDIRKFGVVTEALGQHVMIFCNQVADIVHELTHTYGGAANKNIGNAFLLVWKPTVASIKRMSLMKEQAAAIAAREKYTGPRTHTIAEGEDIIEEEEDESTTTNGLATGSRLNGTAFRTPVKGNSITPKAAAVVPTPRTVFGVGAGAGQGGGEGAGQWAQKTPRKEAFSPGELNNVAESEVPTMASVGTSSMSLRRRAALALIEKPIDQNNSINTPAAAGEATSGGGVVVVDGHPATMTTMMHASGSSSSALTHQHSSGTTTTQTGKLMPPSMAFRGSVSVAGHNTSVLTNGQDQESSSADVDTEFSDASTADALGDSGLHTGGPMNRKKRPSHSITNHANSDSPVHAAERRGSAMGTDIPASIAEVSKSAHENEVSSHIGVSTGGGGGGGLSVLGEGVRTTLSTPKPPVASSLLSPGSELRRKESLAESKNGPMWDSLKHLADQSLIAFLSTIKQVAITQELAHWRSNELMRKLLGAPPSGDYEVDMGFGLHVGWAIEGAIGSIYKIDASYLSPNVNIASRLCGATKQYGVRILISGPLHSLMQPEIQKRCRHLDAITVKGSKLPLDIFTFDVGHLALKSPAMIQAFADHDKQTAAAAASAAAAAVAAGPSSSPVVPLASSDASHAIDMPRHHAIRLQSVATVHDDDNDAATAADIPVDDSGNPIDPNLLPIRPSELSAMADEEARKAKKKARRGSGAGAGHLLSNGAKILSSLKHVFKSEAAPAAESAHGVLDGPTGLPSHNRVHPHELPAPVSVPVDSSQSVAPPAHLSIDTSSPNANGLELMPMRPPPPTLAQSPPSIVITSPTGAKTPKPKVESGDFSAGTLASICAQLQLGLPDDFVKLFNEASSLYIKGSWSKARDVLEKKFLKQWPNDKPAKVLLDIMRENNFVKPTDWKGYRKLTAK